MGIITLGLLNISSVYAQPIREASPTQEQSTHVLEPREPVSEVTCHTPIQIRIISNSILLQRLIPDTENYLAKVLDNLGVGDHETDTSTQAAYTPTPTIKVEQDHPVNSIATPSTTGSGATFTTVIHNGNDKPIENIQIGNGWDGRKELRASDLPMIFDAVYKEMESRFRNVIDSSDEVGLGL